jgi:DNA-binding GntR family transcriptional regulator
LEIQERSVRPLHSSSLRENAAQRLREMIWSGELAPGERINERLISGDMAISRPPLREAIRELAGEGLIEVTPRKGARVKAFTANDVRELYIVRWTLEHAAANILAHRQLEEHEVDKIREAIRDLEVCAEGSLQESIEADLEFHRTIVQLCGVERLGLIWEQLLGELRLALRLVRPEYFCRAFVDDTHRPLVAAILLHDHQGVSTCMDSLRQVGDDLASAWSMTEGAGEAGESVHEAELPSSTWREND